MILVDTSVWIDHLRSPDVKLQELLQNDEVVTHPFVRLDLALVWSPLFAAVDGPFVQISRYVRLRQECGVSCGG